MSTPKQQRRRASSQVSAHTKDRAEAAKAYISQKYSRLKEKVSERASAWQEVISMMDDLRLTEDEREVVTQKILQREAESLRERRRKVTVFDFQPVEIIGRGAFGEVRVVRHKETGKILAMKKMNKSEMMLKNQIKHVRAEKDALASAPTDWVVTLDSSFQDEHFLYLAMEFLPGGDLMSLLIKKDVFTEEETRFYAAELVLALDSVHKLNCIHRDLKPDNVLLDAIGHIKLSDFGLCKFVEARAPAQADEASQPRKSNLLNPKLAPRSAAPRSRQAALSTVGTPDYIAPEVFTKQGYSHTVDWWSLGTIIYEMMVGFPPFSSDSPLITVQKIVNWRKHFAIPREAKVSPAAGDLVRRLICDVGTRLGNNGVEEIMAHPFFFGVEWHRLKSVPAPFIPQLTSETDTRYFDHFTEIEPFYPSDPAQKQAKATRPDANFIGYTFKRDYWDDHRSVVAEAVSELKRRNRSAAHSFLR